MLYSLDIIGAGLFAFLGASLIVAGLAVWARLPVPVRASARPEATVFLFEGEHIVDATPAARRALQAQAAGPSDLARVLRLLGRGFGADLSERLADLPTGGRLSLASLTGAGTLDVAEEGGALRLTLRPDGVGASALDRLAFEATRDELNLLRGLAEDAPQPVWTLDARGELTWANQAYLALADLVRSSRGQPVAQAAWPVAPLFEQPSEVPAGKVQQERLPLAPPDFEEPLWYDVASIRRGSGSIHFATDVTGLVQAEAARLQFVQTLAKTFAQLSTGLVVFDRSRRLVLFNPAFVDLTGLPIDFLSARPLVQAVLDRLRDARILPEPRDYATWRERVAALEAAAAEGDYRETWTLPGGQTYRVTGRPHPDGALAFLFEDISGEVSLARRVRTDLDMTRDLLDALDEAVAVFTPEGTLTLSNSTYAKVWGHAGAAGSDTDLDSAIARWEAACPASPLWGQLRRLPSAASGPVEDDLRLLDGQRLRLRVTAMPQGALLVRFQTQAAEDAVAVASPEIHVPVRQSEPA